MGFDMERYAHRDLMAQGIPGKGITASMRGYFLRAGSGQPMHGPPNLSRAMRSKVVSWVGGHRPTSTKKFFPDLDPDFQSAAAQPVVEALPFSRNSGDLISR